MCYYLSIVGECMKKKKKGFTLIEMLAVIVIIAIIMALVLPAATRVRNNNKTRIYKEYESMMVEYAKVNELNYQDSIDLIDLDELEKVKNECSGYVEIDHSTNPPTYA
jgi:type IV pilus assembly protein PilA